jgi:radical SAM superfamily enzyme YgiQ (UPF0313 family)
MKKRLLLVSPAEGLSTMEHNVIMNFPPLSLMTLAAVVPDDYEVTIVDERAHPLALQSLECDVVGITAFTCQATRAYDIAAHFRQRKVPVIMGGIHASMVPEEAMRHVDSVVVGEPDLDFAGILRDFERGELKPLYRIAQLPDITKIPMARFDLVQRKDYHLMTVQNSRGCPFKCEFCSVTAFSGASHRMKTEEQIYREVMACNDKVVLLVDDNLVTGSRRSTEQGLKTFRRLKDCGVRWGTQISINIVEHPDLLKAAAESGAMVFYIGLETLSPEILKDIQKPFNVKHAAKGYRDAIHRLHDNGIMVIGGLIIGNDKDTPDSIKRMIDFVWESEIDGTEFQPLTPYPGTPLFDRLKAQGRILYTNYPEDWGRYTNDYVVFRPINFTPDQLFEMSHYLYRETATLWKSIRRALVSYRNTRSVDAWRMMLYNFGHKQFADQAAKGAYEPGRHRYADAEKPVPSVSQMAQ